jgi:branched-chain amino acid transport system substrate-binding protein
MTAAQGAAYCSKLSQTYGEYVGSFGGYLGGDARGGEAADLTVQGLKNAGKDLTLDSFIKGLEAIKGYKDIFNGPQVSFGPNIRQGANSSFLAQVKGGKWVRVTEPLSF